MPLYRNPDPPAESFWVTIAAIWLPLLGLIFWAQDEVPVGKLILLGLAFNVAVLFGLAYLRPEGRPDAAERRRLAFFGFQWVVGFGASLACLSFATALTVLLMLALPRAWRQQEWIRELIMVVSGLLFPLVREWLERRLLDFLARLAKRRADSP